MYHAFFSKAQELLDQHQPFVMAMVVRAEKPTSGKPGDKALITADGTMHGWIGGSCSQPTVIREALKALKEGKSRFIRLSPNPDDLTPRDGLIEFPMTCFSGGTLEIYIEPQYPQPRVLVIGSLPVARALAELGRVMKYDVVVVDPDQTGEADRVVTKLADIPAYIHPDTWAVVATHGSYDEPALEQVLRARPRYIGLVASQKRFQSVVEYLTMQGFTEADMQRIKAPAGLNIHAQEGDEIALSIMAEIVQQRHTTPPNVEAAPEHAHEPIDIPVQAVSGTAIDPVCGMEVDMATAKFTAEHDGKTYYFCAPGCKRTFMKNPQDYLIPHQLPAVDPVCGMTVHDAHYMTEYEGKRYYFCGDGCKEAFDQNPEGYIKVKS
jgi:xanthine dehydrogenase accessory factor